MDELKTLKDVKKKYEKEYKPRKLMDVYKEYYEDKIRLGQGDCHRDVFMQYLEDLGIKWIKELSKENVPQYDDDGAKEYVDYFKNKYGIIIQLDDEYDWGNTQVEFLIEWIKYIFDISEEDLK